MSKRQFVAELAKGDRVDDLFSIIGKKPPRTYRQGNGYRFDLTVMDRTGIIELTYWGPKSEAAVRKMYDSLREGDVVRVTGTVNEYNGSEVIHVNPDRDQGIIAACPEDYEMDDFVACTERDPEEMYEQLQGYIAGMKDPNLRALLERMFSDRTFCDKFKKAPASIKYHCNWMGGLLEHTMNVIRICDSIAQLYPKLDRELLLAGAILHDIGKVEEYTISTNISRSTDGQLMGHLYLGAEMVRRGCTSIPEFPENLKTKLVHMVLASHGTPEKGSPTEPSFPEAKALSYADDMDATLEQYIAARENGGSGDPFVHDPRLDRWIYTR